MTHDYKAAQEWLWQKFRGKTVYEGHPLEAIDRALKIADKMMQEPSHASEDSFYESVTITSRGSVVGLKTGFKAMRDQMLREIENESKN